MGWAKFSDDAPESEHILALPVPARWLWAAAIMKNRGYRGGRSPFISRARAEAVAREQDVPLKHIKDLEDSGRWEPVEGGWNIHDYEDFLPSQREDSADHEPNPVKQAAGAKGAAVRWQHINKVDGSLIAANSRADGKVIAPRAPVRVDPVPVPDPKPEPETLKAPPIPPTRQQGAKDGYDDATTELAAGIQELLGRGLSTIEILECQAALNQYAYLSAQELVERAKDHQEWCTSNGHPPARTVGGFSDSWRRENDHRSDQGHPKAARVQLGRTAGMTHIGDIAKELLQP